MSCWLTETTGLNYSFRLKDNTPLCPCMMFIKTFDFHLSDLRPLVKEWTHTSWIIDSFQIFLNWTKRKRGDITITCFIVTRIITRGILKSSGNQKRENSTTVSSISPFPTLASFCSMNSLCSKQPSFSKQRSFKFAIDYATLHTL